MCFIFYKSCTSLRFYLLSIYIKLSCTCNTQNTWQIDVDNIYQVVVMLLGNLSWLREKQLIVKNSVAIFKSETLVVRKALRAFNIKIKFSINIVQFPRFLI